MFPLTATVFAIPIEGRNWTFAADTGQRMLEGKPVWLKLASSSNTKIRRHVKIKADANPFDPGWRGNPENRAFLTWYGIHRTPSGKKPS